MWKKLEKYCENPPRYDFIFGILGFIVMAATFTLFMFGLI